MRQRLALVHDIGKLVMVRYMKADVSAILALRNERGISFVEAERALFGCDHAEVGAEMARRWGFPVEIVYAASNTITHRRSSTRQPRSMPLLSPTSLPRRLVLVSEPRAWIEA